MKTYFLKKRKLEINIKNDELKHFKGKEEQIMNLYDKLPYNSDIMDSNALAFYVGKYQPPELDHLLTEEAHDSGRWWDVIRWYFQGMIPYQEYRKIFRVIDHSNQQKDEDEETPIADESFEGWGEVGDYQKFCDNEAYNKVLKTIRSKIRMRDITTSEASLRKWSRINRWFIQKTSYKPLMQKTIESTKKKKIMFIVDCSGSMGYASYQNNAAYKGMSFVAWVVNSWVFDVSHVIMHSSGWWENIAKRIKKGELFSYTGGWEGFESVDDNLDADMLLGVDYIITITDLCICDSAQQGLYDYLKKGKKHLVLSFQESWNLKWMNVRTIEKISDMTNALVTITW